MIWALNRTDYIPQLTLLPPSGVGQRSQTGPGLEEHV